MDIQDIVKLTNCYIEKCKKEVKARSKVRSVWFANSNKNYEDYQNKIITRKEFLKRANKLDSDYLNSIQEISIHKCEIANCYDLLKVKLDHISSKINYKKKNANYTIDDYINILKKNNKKNNADIKLVP